MFLFYNLITSPGNKKCQAVSYDKTYTAPLLRVSPGLIIIIGLTPSQIPTHNG